MTKVYLANGLILQKYRYDVEYCGNGYKYVDGQWFIFGNESLFPVTNPIIIIKLNILNQEN
ncbi:MAG: hypothetical protein KAS32_01160 [Candidatus Peribacteraceae bacterium]|nr:hypothetical protein [Candidatus Peribacteraceae bacterium]